MSQVPGRVHSVTPPDVIFRLLSSFLRLAAALVSEQSEDVPHSACCSDE